MLNNIPHSFSPELLSLMMSMGHGECLLISDGNYPALTNGDKSTPRIFLPAGDIALLLSEVLHFFPLDETDPAPVAVMEAAKESGAHAQYTVVLSKLGINAQIKILERFDFYKEASNAAGIVITSSTVKGGNVLIKKGVVKD